MDTAVDQTWMLNDFVAVGAAIFCALYLLSLLTDYWINKDGLRKGATLMAVIALLLLAAPGAQRLSFSLGGYEVLIENVIQEAADASQSQVELSEQNLAMKAQMTDVLNSLDEIRAQSREQSKQLLNGILEIQKNPGTAQEADFVEKLLPQQPVVTPRVNYLVTAHSLRFDKICERANDTGEFYWTFLANGQLISERNFTDKYTAREGDVLEIIDGETAVIEKRSEEDTFRLGGQLKEWDGKTLFSGKTKLTDVGPVAQKIALRVPENLLPVSIAHPTGRDICSATLFLEIKEQALEE